MIRGCKWGMPMTNSRRPGARASAVMAAPEGGAVFTRRTFLDGSLAAVAGAIMGPEASTKEVSPSSAGQQFAPPSEELAFLSLEGASALIRAKKVSPVELTQACISRIERLN